ncbi:MAG: hypothetical protein IPM57_08145 [Oligoflexia bacterium]|nr:hypothetical protein [Oligoflexia bacterium]
MIYFLLCFFWAQSDEINKPVSVNPPITIPLTKVEKDKKILKSGPVVLDARPFFEYSSGHAEKAQPIRWEDYSQIEVPNKGLLEPDLNLIVRKLRAYGISPDSEVIILGKGKNGSGEEGRIAWMLNYLGIKNIKIKYEPSFVAKRTVLTIQNNYSANIWLPKANENIRIRMGELKKILNKKDKNYVLIDTRSEEEFNQKHLPGAIHIDFKEFISSNNEPLNESEFKSLMTKNKISFESELIFYCSTGVKSGYATFVATQNGFNARHFDGGSDLWFHK